MARPKEYGIEYFSFNVDFFDDTKLLFVSSKYEEIGELVTVKLLCWIYRTDGYYTEWNDEISMLFTKKSFSNVKFQEVNDIVRELIKRDFFNEHLFKKYGVLTSKGIQKRWKEATKRRKVRMKHEFDLISYCKQNNTETTLSDTETTLSDTETTLSDTETTSQSTETQQSKVKESKVKESIVKESINSSDSLFSIFDLEKSYLSNTSVVQAVVNNKENKFKNVEHLKALMKEFMSELKQRNILVKTESDFAYHFRNWCKKRNSNINDVQKIKNTIPIG